MKAQAQAPKSFAVVGRFSRRPFGPFETVAEATNFIKRGLGSSERMYSVEVADFSTGKMVVVK